jgi:hypothetical protein
MTDAVITEWDEDEEEWIDVLPEDDAEAMAMASALIPWDDDETPTDR